MARYLLRRFIAFCLILFTISLLSFWIMRLLPGDPIVKHLGTSYTAENARQFAHQVGLDKGFFAHVTSVCQASFNKVVALSPVKSVGILRFCEFL